LSAKQKRLNDIDLRMTVIHAMGLEFVELGDPGLDLCEEIDDFIIALYPSKHPATGENVLVIPENKRQEIRHRLRCKLQREIPPITE
jgi:hypothetical protein